MPTIPLHVSQSISYVVKMIQLLLNYILPSFELSQYTVRAPSLPPRIILACLRA